MANVVDSFLHSCVVCLKSIGGFIFVYREGKYLFKQRVFTGQTIHGINVYDNDIVVHGGKLFAVSKLYNQQGSFSEWDFQNYATGDWIQAVVKYKSNIVVVSAHNVAQLQSLDSEKEAVFSQCTEKCILYSCHIVGKCAFGVVVLGGTVFSEIIIWAPDFQSNEEQPVLHRLSGHKGVIFSIAVNDGRSWISSTSDDRSIRLWSIASDGELQGKGYWESATIQLVHSLFGHTARVWKSSFFGDYVVSSGEDSSLCVWNCHGQMVHCWKLHQDSGIRGLDCGAGHVWVGGEDGSLCEVKLVVEGQGGAAFAPQGHVPRRVAVVCGGVLVATETGRLLHGTKGGTLRVVYENDDFINYCLMEVSLCRKFVALGSLKGRVVVVNLETMRPVAESRVVPTKILAMHWTGPLLAVCTVQGDVRLLAAAQLTPVHSVLLPASKERWTTCALLTQHVLVLGDRMGSVFVYDESGESAPKQRFVKIHGYLGVSDVVEYEGRVLTAGRDGTVKEFAVVEGGLELQLTRHLPFPWLWRIVPRGGELLVLGFSSANFVVWSMGRHAVLAELSCGGGHRSCDFTLGDKFIFAYIKEKTVHVEDLVLDRVRQLRAGHHGKAINCLALLRPQPLVLVTGGEDTTLRIVHVVGDDLQEAYCLKRHVSNVRAVSVCEAPGGSRWIVAGGGRAQVTVWRYDPLTSRCKEMASDMLHKDRKLDWKSAEVCFDPETRYMCLDTVLQPDGAVLIAAGCSDCHIRVFSFDGALTLKQTVPYTHCVLKVTFLRVAGCCFVVSAATDGRVVIWDLDRSPLHPVASFPLHQSGVNALDTMHLPCGRVLLATGGDDNMACLTLLEFSSSSPNIVSTWKNSKTHACQITGVKLFRGWMVTSSIDQRITEWLWSCGDKTVTAEFSRQHMTDIADVQGLEVLAPGDTSANQTLPLCVFGQGLEIVNTNPL